MSMRKTEEPKKRPAERVSVGHVHSEPSRGDAGMPAGRMDAPAPGAAAAEGGMPRGEMGGANGAGMVTAETGTGEMPAGAMDGAPSNVAGTAGGADGMPRGEMNGAGPGAGGEMPPLRAPLAGPAGVAGGAPLNLEIGGEWRLTLTTTFMRPAGG